MILKSKLADYSKGRTSKVINKIYLKFNSILCFNLKQLNTRKMGIDGLLAILKPIVKKAHISQFRNKTLAIDALPWIYKGIYGANIQLGQSITQNQNAFLYYIIQMIDMLEFYNIKLLFVFDGRSLMAKNKTLQKRKKAKEDNKKKAQELIQKKQDEKGRKVMASYITIDEAKLLSLMSLLKQRKIEFVVAPYEADSQISKLFNMKKIDAAVTEDSDLIVYGVDVIMKLKETGQCDFLTLAKDEQYVNRVECPFAKNFIAFTPQKRICCAILSGCDYVDSIKGIGIKKAIKLVQQNQSLDKIVQKLQKDPKLSKLVPQNYLKQIQNALLIFLFATTYNPEKKELQCLNNRQETYSNEFILKLSEDQVMDVVGGQYQFGENHYRGEVNCKNQQQRQFTLTDLKLIPSILNGDDVGFGVREDRTAKKGERMSVEIREFIADQTTSIFYGEDSLNQGLAFLLQKELVARFFSCDQNKNQNNIQLQSSQNPKENIRSEEP